jgi:hypothetical protein
MATINITAQPEIAFKKYSACAAYWDRVQHYDGKELTALQVSCAKQPPAVNKYGKPESLGGWVSYFEQVGLVTVG